MRRLSIFLVILPIVLIAPAVFPVDSPAQEAAADPDTTARDASPPKSGAAYDLNAGTSQIRSVNGQRVLELADGVTITHGDVVITSQRGRHFIGDKLTFLFDDVTIDQPGLHMEADEGEYRRLDNTAILKRNVRIVDAGWTITCDRAVYNRDTDVAWLYGNVVVVDSASTLHADSIRYDKGAEIAEVFGDVSMINRDEAIAVDGRHGFYYRKRGEAVIDVDPVLFADINSREPIRVVSDTLRFFPEDNRATATGRVKIIKGNMITQADSAVVVDSEKRAELYGNPLAKQGNLTMQGERMFLFYDGEEINRIDIRGEAAIRETPTDTLIVGRDNWVEGDSMILYVHDDRMDSLRVDGNAASEFYPVSPDRIESNYAEGDAMFFVFERDSLSYVKIVGNAKGVYRYINLGRNETADSLRAEIDTSLTYIPFHKEAEIVSYNADTIRYFARDRDLILDSKARLAFSNRTLLADRILFDAEMQLLDATGSPILIDGQDKFYGEQMNYDLETGIGLMQNGQTQFLEGYYQGEHVATVGNNVMKLWRSTYTTCDLKESHYHFRSNTMKVYIDDKVVTGPVVLYIGDTPVFVLPFFAENIHRGRSSGILRPDFEFGVNSRTGRFIRNIGYYWATSDYMDFQFITDFNEEEFFRIQVLNQYRKRYAYNGNVNLQWFRNIDGDPNTTLKSEWTASARHTQPGLLGERSNFTSDLRFVSSDIAPKVVSTLDDVENIIDRRIESRVTLSKSWDKVGFSASARRVQLLDVRNPRTVNLTSVFPQLSLSIPSRTLYFGEKTRSGSRPVLERILDNIRYNPGLSGNRVVNTSDSLSTEEVTVNGSISLSSHPKFGFINFSPSVSLTDNYKRTSQSFRAFSFMDTTGTVNVPARQIVTDENDFNWNFGIGANTNIYGTFYPTIGSLRGIRHTMQPRVRYTYRPGRNGARETESIGLSLTNAFDIKVQDGDEERRLAGVFIWSLGSSFNPNAPGRKGFSTVSSNMNLKLFGTNISMNQLFEPYLWDVLSTSVTSSFGFRGRHELGSSSGADTRELNVVAADTTEARPGEELDDGQSEYDTGELDESLREGLPWSLNAAVSYSQARNLPPRSTLNLNGSINITRFWLINYSAQYDVVSQDLLGQRFEITRDLHCWQISFIRQQFVNDWEFYFRINLLAHPEVFTEQGNRGLGSTSFNSPYSF